MCATFGKTKQAYYKQFKSVELKSITNEIMLGLIEKKRTLWKRGSGRNLH